MDEGTRQQIFTKRERKLEKKQYTVDVIEEMAERKKDEGMRNMPGGRRV